MICDKIKEARTLNGLTQAELAKKLGITRSSVNAWEMGISIPSTQYLVELSSLLKVTTDFLLNLEKEMKVDISSLSNKEQEIVLSLIDVLKQKGQE